jgi:hypothetical protein
MPEALWWAARLEAERIAEHLDGVVAVGIGPRLSDSEPTGEVAVIIYVAPTFTGHATIPSTIGGLPTEVRTLREFDEISGTTISGSLQIRRTPDAHDRPKPGTLGYIATRSGESMMLSCEHVMLHARPGDARLFHPDVSRSLDALKNSVGSVVDGVRANVPFINSQGEAEYFVDAAIASIDSGVTALRIINGVGAIAGIADRTATPTRPDGRPFRVRKHGARTGVTQGHISDVGFTLRAGSGPSPMRLIVVQPDPDHSFLFRQRLRVPEDILYDLLDAFPLRAFRGRATQVGDDEIEFEARVFGAQGDSGSCLVDVSDGEPGHVVGVLVAGTVFPIPAYSEDGRLRTFGMPSGGAYCCHIGPVVEQLHITLEPSVAHPDAEFDVLPGADLRPQGSDRVVTLNRRLVELERELDARIRGRHVTDLLRRHADELVELVHHRRRVMVQWHRNKGPVFAKSFIDGIIGDAKIVTTVDRVSRSQLLRRMHDALMAEASPRLKQSLDEDGAFLLDVLERSDSIDELVENIDAPA